LYTSSSHSAAFESAIEAGDAQADEERRQLEIAFESAKHLPGSMHENVTTAIELSKSTLESHLQSVLDGLQQEMDKLVRNTDDSGSQISSQYGSQVKEYKEKMENLISRLKTKELQDILAEVQMNKVNPLEEQQKRLGASIADLEALNRKDAKSLEQELNKETTRLGSDVKSRYSAMENGMVASGKDLSKREAELENGVTRFADGYRQTISQTAHDSEAKAKAEFGAEESRFGVVQGDIGVAMSGQRQTQAVVLKSLQELQEDGAAQSRKFSSALKAAGRKLAALMVKDHKEMEAVLVEMDALAEDITRKIDYGREEETNKLQKIVDEAKIAVQEFGPKLDIVMKTVEEVTVQSQNIADKASRASEQAWQEGSDFVDGLNKLGENLAAAVSTESLARQNETGTILSDTKNLLYEMDVTLRLLHQISHKVGATIKYKMGKLQIEENYTERALEDALSLEKYQEEDAISKIRDRLAEASQREEELKVWKDDVENKTNEWRHDVQEQFKKMGHELDLTEMKMAEMKAMEDWAVNEQMRVLEDHLNMDMKDLDDKTRARLGALAKSSGQKIAALMARTDLTEEEKAKMIADIREQARQQSIHILKSQDMAELEQETAARHLDVSVKEMENAMERIAKLESHGAPTVGIYHQIHRIKKVIEQANMHLESGADLASLLDAGMLSEHSNTLMKMLHNKNAPHPDALLQEQDALSRSFSGMTDTEIEDLVRSSSEDAKEESAKNADRLKDVDQMTLLLSNI